MSVGATQIGLYMKGWPDQSEGAILRDQPLPHKVLACGALVVPFLPMTLLAILVGLFGA